MDYTLEQRRAIEYRENKSTAISASAGSGKTAVLVEHIAYLISNKENPVYADRLAAITFTEKAAAELRKRLEAKIDELISKNPDDDFLTEQYARLSQAKISTISSFCLSLIRDNIRFLPIDEGFSVCDEITEKSLSDKALKKLSAYIYKKLSNYELKEVSRRIGGEKNIFEAVREMYDFLSNIPFKETWIKAQLKNYENRELYEEQYLKPYKDKAKELSKKLSELTERTDDIIGEDSCNTINKTVQRLREYFALLITTAADILKAFNEGDYSGALKISTQKLPVSPKTTEFSGLSDLKDEIKEFIKNFGDYAKLFENIEETRLECLKAFELLYKLEEIYASEFSKLKRKAGVLDFSDLERFALEAVNKGAGKGIFDFIIVDEFQDSNDIQYEIFKALSDGEKNLYFVGDEKQCIYSFRNANPEIFAGLSSLENDRYVSLSLNKNFRSSEDVIFTVNRIFGGKKSLEDLPKSFSKAPWKDMTCGRGIAARKENRSELVVINTLKGSETESLKREALYVAKRISQMVKGGFSIHDKNALRPCGYGDFAVLTRNNASAAQIRSVLEEYNIPCAAVGDKAFTSLIEIELALSILSCVLRPNDDTSTATALMSPVYCFSAEDMARLRLIENPFDKKKRKSLYGCLSELINSENEIFDDKLKEKAQKFLADMRRFRKTATASLSYELMSEIYSVTRLIEIMSCGRKGIERTENLRLLLHYARNIPDISDFLAIMKHVKRNKLEMPQAVVKEQEERSVKLMTVHSSKGLQFPIVFLCDSNKTPNISDKRHSFIFDAKYGLGISLCDYNKGLRGKTVSHSLIGEIYEDKVLGEELRLLYVAMTRAEEKLILTASNYVTEKTAEAVDGGEWETLGKKGGYLEFITRRLISCPDAFNFMLIASKTPIESDIGEPPYPLVEKNKNENKKIDLERIKERIAFKYPYEKATITPAKLTATALGINPEETSGAENTVRTAFYMGLPIFMKKNKPLTPKELGDVYHRIMQYLDFKAENADSELERLLSLNIITDSEKSVVNPKDIERFLKSSIAKRASEADEVYREFQLFTTINEAGYENPSKEDLSFVQGIADMFFVENGEIVLVDYKTNKNTTSEKLIAEYSGQLAIYKQAIEEMMEKKVKECVLFGFEVGEVAVVL